MKTGSLVKTPSAVAFSSSSSSALEDVSSDADVVRPGGLLMPSDRLGSRASLELVMIRSDSLSLSSYSSWLLPATLARRTATPRGRGSLRPRRRLLRPWLSYCTRTPVGPASSAAAEEREEEEG